MSDTLYACVPAVGFCEEGSVTSPCAGGTPFERDAEGSGNRDRNRMRMSLHSKTYENPNGGSSQPYVQMIYLKVSIRVVTNKGVTCRMLA